MRLSDFENEKAIEILAEIIDPAVEIMNDTEIATILRSGKPPLFAVKRALKYHKTAIIDIVAALHGETRNTVKFTMPMLIRDVLDMFSDPELQSVFSSQSQRNASESSGSATVSTEARGD